MKILMVTNKVKTYALGFQNVLEPLGQLGHEVIWAADFSQFVADKSVIPCKIEQIDISTNPFNKSNVTAYKQILDIIERNNIEAVMCSTPIGGALARLAAKKKDIKPVLYEAHGFLFFKGAPLINQTVYKWEEKLLAHYTDILITITNEDYAAARKFKLRSGERPYLVHGAGVKVGVRVEINRTEKRRSVAVPEDAFVIVSACGVGPEKENLEKLAEELGVSERFHLMGYRTDMAELMAMSDVFTMMSFREGMPRSLLEAMDLGLPCVGSDTRGIRDLIDSNGGYICSPRDPKAFANAFNALRENEKLRLEMGTYNKGKVQDYSADVVKRELYDIYKKAFSAKAN